MDYQILNRGGQNYLVFDPDNDPKWEKALALNKEISAKQKSADTD